MSNDLMIPDRAEVPAYILNPELAKQANEDAVAGISTGVPPRVKLVGKQFALVDGNGEETPIPQGKLATGPDDNLYLPLIVLRAKPAIQKSYYIGAYNPKAEAQAPDCFSNDGITPDPSSAHLQCDTCALCPMNAYGSGKDQAGNPTDGKACSDNKVLAVFVPQQGIHQFKLPPSSLKNFGIYVKQLSAAGIALGTVRTFVGFDMTATFPKLVFKFGGYVPENTIEKLATMAQSAEVEEIVSSKISSSRKAIAAPAPAPAPAPVQAAPAPVQTPVDDLGLEIETPQPAAKPAGRPKKEAPVQAAPAPVQAAPAPVVVSDDELRASLGL
jgi:hypothetical protein